MKRISLLILSALMLLSGCNSKNGEYALQVLATNDVHGSWFATDYVTGAPRRSLMGVKCHVDSIRTEFGVQNTLLLDSGDCLQGDNAAFYYDYVDTVGTHLYTRLASYMGYDAVTVGNHDIEVGPAMYGKMKRELAAEGIPFLAGNAFKSDGTSYFPEYKVFKRSGLKVLVLGYTNPNIAAWLDKSLWPEIEFESLLPLVQNRVDAIKAKVKPDVTIVSVHSGAGKGDRSALESQGLDLYNNLHGVDVLLCSHDHLPLLKQREDCLLIDTGSRASHLGHANVKLTFNKGKLMAKHLEGELIDIDANKVDAEMQKAFETDFEKVKAFTMQPIGYISADMHTRDAFAGQSFYMDIIHKVQLEVSGADISFSAPLTFNKTLKAGELIYNDLFTLYPYENSLNVLKLTGKEIKNYLEYSYSLWLSDKPGHVLRITDNASERYGTSHWSFVYPSFNFDSAAGIDYIVDLTKPYGKRIKITSPFDENATYTVAMTSYRAAGGGDLLFKGAGLSREECEARLVSRYPEIREMVYKFILKHGTITPESVSGVGSWRFIPASSQNRLEKDMSLLFD